MAAQHQHEPIASPPDQRRRSRATGWSSSRPAKERLRALLDLIGGAQQSIKMLMYMFNPDEAGTQCATPGRGGAARGPRAAADRRLRLGGGPDFFTALDRERRRDLRVQSGYGRRYLLRNHRSYRRLTTTVAIIGGANIDDSYMTDRGAEHWRDLWLRIEGPEARRPAAISIRCFAGRRGNARSCARSGGWSASTASGAGRCSGSSPALSMRNRWWRSIGRDIGAASTSTWSSLILRRLAR